MSKIFISYRRIDSIDETGRLYDHLLKYFDRHEIFKDIDNIPIGKNYESYVADSIKDSKVMIVMIGKFWLSCTDSTGMKRLEKEDDMVRIEIATALRENLTVIPVLIDEAVMPTTNELPEILKPLAVLQASKLRPDPDFIPDIQRLMRALTTAIKEPWIIQVKRNKKIKLWITVSSLILLAVLTTFYIMGDKKKSDLIDPEQKLSADTVGKRSTISNVASPSVEQIKNDLIGKKMLGWEFTDKAEFHSLKIMNTTFDTLGGIGYDIKLGLEEKGDFHESEILVVYKSDKSSWRFDTAICKYITFDYVIPTNTFYPVNIPRNAEFSFNNQFKLTWKIGYAPTIYHKSPTGPADLPNAQLYWFKSEENGPVTLKFAYSPTY